MEFTASSLISLIFTSIYAYELQNKLPLGMGQIDIESIEYDPINKQYLIASFYFSQVIPFDQDVIEDSDYNLTDTSYLSILNGFPINIWRNPIAFGGSGAAGTPFNNGEFQPKNFTFWRPAGMEIVDGNLYIVDFYFGRVSEYNLNTTTYTTSIFINNIDGLPANLDGLCHDPANPNMLYTTDFGYTVNAFGAFIPSGTLHKIHSDECSVLSF